MVFMREFLYFQYGFQKAVAISFYCIQYYEYDHCFFYSFPTSWNFTYIVNESEKRTIILNEVLCDRRRTIRKTKMAKRKNLNKKKELAGIKMVGQTYGGNTSYR